MEVRAAGPRAVYVDGIYLKRSWSGSYENVAVMVAIGVNDDGYREVIGRAEGFTESSECWRDFLSWLKSRGLRGVRIVVDDKAAGMVGPIAEVFPEAKYQRCTVHFYRNMLAKVPEPKRPQVAAMLKAIHAMEPREAASAKAEAVAGDLESMRLREAAKVVRVRYAERWRTVRCRASIGGASARTTPSSARTGKYAAEPAWSAPFPTASPRSCWWPPAWSTSPTASGAPAATWTYRFSRSNRADG